MDTPSELIIVRQRYTPYGGAERFISRMLERLAENGLRIRVLCREWSGDGTAEVTRLPLLSITRAQRDRAFARLACTHIHANPNALVQSHERIDCCDIYRAGDGVHREWLAQRGRRRDRWQRLAEHLSPFHRYTLRAEQRMFSSPRLKAVICNSQMVKAEIMRHFGLPGTRLRVIHNGVDTQRFHPRLRAQHRAAVRSELAIDDNESLFLFLGSGYERKGLDGVLDALTRSRHKPRLLVIGKDRHEPRYRATAQRLGLGGRVRFLGPQQDVERYYGAVDGVLLPTLYDPFPNVVIEAMACGLPVVTSSKSGSVDIIESGRNGLVCDALDVDTLATYIDRLCTPAQCAHIGEAARASVEHLTLDNMAQQYLALYSELLGTPPHREQ